MTDSNVNGVGIGADEQGEFISVYVTEIKWNIVGLE